MKVKIFTIRFVYYDFVTKFLKVSTLSTIIVTVLFSIFSFKNAIRYFVSVKAINFNVPLKGESNFLAGKMLDAR